ncbi:helix-turn-helix domain-containing protein [Nitrospira sp. Nam80]
MNAKTICVQFEESLAQISTRDLPIIVGELERIKAQMMMRLLFPQQKPTESASVEGKYMTANEVAERFHVTRKWLYRHKKKLPHSQPSRKVLLFPEQALLRWFEQHT